jgi:hypothetical protein
MFSDMLRARQRDCSAEMVKAALSPPARSQTNFRVAHGGERNGTFFSPASQLFGIGAADCCASQAQRSPCKSGSGSLIAHRSQSLTGPSALQPFDSAAQLHQGAGQSDRSWLREAGAAKRDAHAARESAPAYPTP